MSSSSNQTTLRTNAQMITNYDLSKIFVGNNRYVGGNLLNNSSYNDLELLAGTVVGRITATGTLVPYVHTANDGSQYPVGVLAHDVELDSGAEEEDVTICDMGDIPAEKILFIDGSGTTLESIVTNGGRRVKDWLQAQGIKVVYDTTEMTELDPQ